VVALQQNPFSLERVGHRCRAILKCGCGMGSVFSGVPVRAARRGHTCWGVASRMHTAVCRSAGATLRVGQVVLRRVACHRGHVRFGSAAPAAVPVTVAPPPIVRGRGVVGGGSVGRRAAVGALRCARRGVRVAALVALAF
jgi:hypothetical protein